MACASPFFRSLASASGGEDEHTLAEKGGGGVDGSGGPASKSTPLQVEEAIGRVLKNLKASWNRVAVVYVIDSKADPEKSESLFGDATPVISKMLKGDGSKIQPILINLRAGKIQTQIEREKPCPKTGEEDEEGAYGQDGEGTLCFSVPRLRRLAPESLDLELLALASHGIAHLYFSKDESDPRLVQKFFKENTSLTLPNPHLVEIVKQFQRDWEKVTMELESNFYFNKSDSVICQTLGKTHSLLTKYEFLNPMNPKIRLDVKLTMQITLLWGLAKRASGFCGVNADISHGLLEDKKVEEADRTALMRNLLLWRAEIPNIGRKIESFIDPEAKLPNWDFQRASFFLAAYESLPYARLKGLDLKEIQDLRPENISCETGIDVGQAVPNAFQRFEIKPVFNNTNGSLHKGLGGFVMLRKQSYSKGVEVFLIRAKTEHSYPLKSAKILQGLGVVAYEGKTPIPMGRLIRGISDELLLEYVPTSPPYMGKPAKDMFPQQIRCTVK